MRIKTFATAALVSTGVGLGIYMISASNKPASEESSPAAKIASQAVNATPTPVVATVSSAQTMNPTTSNPPQQEDLVAKKVWQEFKYGKELDRYATLEKKALLLEHDKVAKRKLLRDPAFIHSLQPLLTTVPVHDEAAHLQNAAVDFLFEALKSDLRSDVVQVLQAVVADPSVEDESRDLQARKSLAGVKAEILFNWSSIEPSSDPEISRALPGPVSQKIWANVKKQQENNLAESAAFQSQE